MKEDTSNRRIGYELLSFVFWLPIQAIIIGFLDAFGILPSTIAIALGWGGQPLTSHHFPFAIDYYTTVCAYIGAAYTAVGCFLLSAYNINTSKWWKKVAVWYVAYLLLTALLIPEIGSFILDVWFAPVLWLGEIELVNWVQCYISNNKQRKTIIEHIQQ